MNTKLSKYTLILFVFLALSAHAQVTTNKADELYFLGKWYLIAKGMPQGDAKMIMSIGQENGKLSGTITSPIDPSSLFKLQDVTISYNELSAKFAAFNSLLPITIIKKDAENVTGQMSRFPIEGSKKELFKLEAKKKVSPAPQLAKDTALSVVTIDASKQLGKLVRTEQYNNITHHKVDSRDAAFYNKNGIKAKVLRAWISDDQIYDKTTGQYNYEQVNEYLASVSPATDYILANFKFLGLIHEWADTPEKGKPIIEKIFTDLKSKYPKLRYIEVMNEPDFGPEYVGKITSADYYRYYKMVYEAINHTNAKLKPAIPLEVGGPAVAKFDLQWLTAFLDDFKKDTSPNKKLDFVSWHAYFLKPEATYAFLKDDPSLVKEQRKLYEAELVKRGLNKSIPAFITEMGIYPGPLFDQQGSMRNDHLRQAAGLASVQYWFLESDHIYPFNWVMRHHMEGRKDQLVTRDEFGDTLKVNDKFTPYGNTLLMFSKLKANRLRATASTPVTKGKGLYTLATADASGVAAMVWNFQSVNNTGYKVQVNFTNLPPAYKNKDVRVKTYKIDPKNSNYHASLENANLQLVEDKVLKATQLYSTSLFLDPNTLQLFVLEPAK